MNKLKKRKKKRKKMYKLKYETLSINIESK